MRRDTRLDRFIRENRLKPSRVAREADIARQHLLRLRQGKASARIVTAINLTRACGYLLDRDVALDELFDVGDGGR